MSLKENMQMVKEELSSEEKFFESAVKAERFWKKYQRQIIGAVVVVGVAVAGNLIYGTVREGKITASNEAYNTLIANGDDTEAAKVLQENNAQLYDAWRLSRAVEQNDAALLEALTKSSAAAVADVAAYELAVMKKDAAMLDDYAMRPNAFYRDLALVEQALLLMKNNETEKAQQKLASVDSESALDRVAKLLQHYGAK